MKESVNDQNNYSEVLSFPFFSFNYVKRFVTLVATRTFQRQDQQQHNETHCAEKYR